MSILGAALGAVGSIAGGLIGSKGAKDASRAQLAATDKGVKEMRRQFDIARADELENIKTSKKYLERQRRDTAQWRAGGQQAVNQLRILLGLKGEQRDEYGQLVAPFEFEADPGYQFRMDEGQKAIERAAAARGNLLSGKTLKAVGRYGQDYASNEYDRAFGRDMATKSQRFNQLAGLAGYGPMSTGQAPQGRNPGLSLAQGNNLAQMYLGGGNARAAGIVGGGNALAAGLQGAGSAIGDYYTLKSILES